METRLQNVKVRISDPDHSEQVRNEFNRLGFDVSYWMNNALFIILDDGGRFAFLNKDMHPVLQKNITEMTLDELKAIL